jgi:hypothetical protein
MFYLEGYNIDFNSCQEAQRSVGPRDGVEQVGILVPGTGHDGPVSEDELVGVADVLPQAVFVRGRLNAAPHDQVSML